jgi:hypothetical protein
VRALAYVDGSPVVVEGERDGRRWLAFGLDPDGSDLPLRAALPILLRNAIRRLAPAAARRLRPFYRSGDRLSVVDATGPASRAVGPWPIEAPPDDSDSRPIRVTVDLSAARDVTPARPPSPPPPPRPPERDRGREWVRWLAVAAGAFLLADILFFRPRTGFLAARAGEG